MPEGAPVLVWSAVGKWRACQEAMGDTRGRGRSPERRRIHAQIEGRNPALEYQRVQALRGEVQHVAVQALRARRLGGHRRDEGPGSGGAAGRSEDAWPMGFDAAASVVWGRVVVHCVIPDLLILIFLFTSLSHPRSHLPLSIPPPSSSSPALSAPGPMRGRRRRQAPLPAGGRWTCTATASDGSSARGRCS